MTVKLSLFPFLTVSPAFTVQPQSQELENGTLHTFRCTAGTGFPTPTIAWRFQPPGGVYTTVQAAAPGPSSSYTISSPQPANVGNYRCVARNAAGVLGSNTAALTVNGRLCLKT